MGSEMCIRDRSQAGRAALAALCQTYWYPLYAFARRRGHSPPDAQDLTQGFFLHVLENWTLSQVDRLKGKFRLRRHYLAVVREEVARTVSDPAEIDAEIRALCDALIAAERRVMP